jgi:ATP-binding cassette subfamily B protein/subfamily B ATP-binding cassette protein MsbA
MGVFRSWYQQLLNVRVILTLRRALFERLLRLPLAKLSEMKTGGIISRLTDDINTTTGLLQMAVISPGVAFVRLLIAIVILFVINWKLAVTALTVIPPIMLISFVAIRRIRPIYRAIRKEVSYVDGRVGEAFQGIRAVRAFLGERREEHEYTVGHHAITRMRMFARRREIILWSSWGFLMALISVVITWAGGYWYIYGSATIGDITAFHFYTFLLLTPVWRIVESLSELQRSMASMERVFEVLESPVDKPDRPNAIPVDASVSEMRFEDVWFAYDDENYVIKNFELSVPGGSVIALVGRSGAGKTTITDLVARFYDPTRGRITLNGTDLRDYELASYRELLGIVQQDVFLFDGTVRENIAYACRSATLEQVQEVARRANAHEFIVDLPEGYDSVIGERGVKLSGGQRQRLSIARALLADPRILILDEATSNLDTESEQLIQKSMTELLKDRTTFVIAHRLSTITHADQIVVIDDGQIVELGNHQQLVTKQGLYAEMVRRQHDSVNLL